MIKKPINYFKESEKYRPKEVKTLLVGEAPPSSGKTYFYVPKAMSNKRPIKNDRSLPATIFCHYFRERPERVERYIELLNKLKDRGIFLMDIVDEPIKISDRKLKGGIIQENIEYLINQIPLLRNKISSRGIDIEDENIIFLLARKHYKRHLDEEFPNSHKIRWIDFRLSSESTPFKVFDSPMSAKIKTSDYRKELVSRFWKYQQEAFKNWEKYFERSIGSDGRPPVFLKHAAHHNILMKPDITHEMQKKLVNMIPIHERHRWFRSMTSSQALAQSVFGNLKVYGRLDYLNEITDELGKPLLVSGTVSPDNFIMEKNVDFLGEPRPTSLDCFISGDHQVAIECKLSESEIGPCSRPRLRKRDSNYETDFCIGSYTRQRGRKERCSLTEIGVRYWKYIPQLFGWANDIDYEFCPLNKNYQLVRNIFAACISTDGSVSPNNGHAVLIYDERNPAFNKGGKGFKAYEEIHFGLKEPINIRKCSWQKIISCLRKKPDFLWLTDQLKSKYGL